MFDDKFQFQQIPKEFRNYEKLPEILKMLNDATQLTDPQTIQQQFCYLQVDGIFENGKLNQEGCFQVKYIIDPSWSWEQIQGNKTDLSQSCVSQCNEGMNISWNFPFQALFKSKNICGWPKMVITITGQNIMGQNILVGYGSFLIPSIPGYHEQTIYILKPKCKTKIEEIKNYFFGEQMLEQKIIEQSILSGENQEVSKMQTKGFIKVKIQLSLRNFDKLGYSVV